MVAFLSFVGAIEFSFSCPCLFFVVVMRLFFLSRLFVLSVIFVLVFFLVPGCVGGVVRGCVRLVVSSDVGLWRLVVPLGAFCVVRGGHFGVVGGCVSKNARQPCASSDSCRCT